MATNRVGRIESEVLVRLTLSRSGAPEVVGRHMKEAVCPRLRTGHGRFLSFFWRPLRVTYRCNVTVRPVPLRCRRLELVFHRPTSRRRSKTSPLQRCVGKRREVGLKGFGEAIACRKIRVEMHEIQAAGVGLLRQSAICRWLAAGCCHLYWWSLAALSLSSCPDWK